VVKQFGAGVAMMLAASIGAGARGGQPQAVRPPASEQDQVQARYRIAMMERVLEGAVEHGADILRRQVQRVMPDMLLISGAAEARGFRLDGYGVFFDVEVPQMRRSMAWSLRTIIEENSAAALATLQQLKASIERMPAESRDKSAMLQQIKRLEMEVGPPAATPGATGAAPVAATSRGSVTAMNADVPGEEPRVVPSPKAMPEGMDRKLVEDPNRSYEEEVITALIDAMLDHSGPIGIGSEEWLTVAARDNEHRDRLVPGEPYDLLTIVLRVKGSDLAAFRSDRITRDEARKRVEVREF
jgi:hypothetical protein